MSKVRSLLGRLEDVISSPREHRGLVLVAVLPTGYGKTSLPRVSGKIKGFFEKGGRLIHLLPLRSIVSDAAREASKALSPDIVAYQAGVMVGGAYKSPYMAAQYMIATIDSYLLNYYGIPVYEMLRVHWHSDAAYALSRTFDVMMLDEFHLMASGEGWEAERDEVSLLAKQLASLIPPAASQLLKGPLVLTTATMPPSVLSAFLGALRDYLLTNYNSLIGGLRVEVVGYGNDSHPYFRELRESLQKLKVDLEGFNVSVDEEFNRDRCGQVRTRIIEVKYDEEGPLASDVINLLHDAKKMGARRVFIAFNSWRRAYKFFERIKHGCDNLFGKTLLLTGKMSGIDRRNVIDMIGKQSGLCLVATQVVEAGVDFDFDALITEVAPAPQLIQRAGRVARHVKPSDRHIVTVIVPENNVSEAVKGVYDEEATKKTIEKLQEFVGRDSCHGFHWRCPSGGGDAYELILSADEALANRINDYLNGVKRIEFLVEPLLYRAMTPGKALRLLDERLRGSFVRNSAMIPLVPWDLLKNTMGKEEKLKKALNNVKERGWEKLELSSNSEDQLLEKLKPMEITVAVDTDTFLRLRDHLSLCDNNVVLVGYKCHKNRCSLLLACGEGVGIEKLSRRPLTSLRAAFNKLLGIGEESGVWRLIGFLVKEGLYEAGKGLRPPEAPTKAEEERVKEEAREIQEHARKMRRSRRRRR